MVDGGVIPIIFGNNAQAFFASESRVNGIWNAILSRMWPSVEVTGNCLVCPEVRPSFENNTGDKADLVVGHLLQTSGTYVFKMVLAYEGKSSSGDNLTQARQQLTKWLKAATIFHSTKKRCWAVCARGSQVQFWLWDGTQTDDLKKMIIVDLITNAGGDLLDRASPQQVGTYYDPDKSKIYDITNIAQYAQVERIVKIMASTSQNDMDDWTIQNK